MNHTPGPWVNNGEGHIVHYSGDIARVLSDNPADARLLAAAPAMAEALQKALLHMLTGHKLADTDPEAAWKHIHKAEDICRAAIAAAQGEA